VRLAPAERSAALRREHHVETRPRRRFRARAKREHLGQERIVECLEQGGELLARFSEQRHNLGLGLRLRFLCADLLHVFPEVDFLYGNALAVQHRGKRRGDRDVRQRLPDRPGLGRRLEAVLTFGHVLRDLDRVFPHGPECGRQLFSTVIVHRSKPPSEPVDRVF
jgi:hypothetical protein